MDTPIWTIPPDLVRHEGPSIASQATWHLPAAIWDPIRLVAQGEGIIVADLDTGYDTDHPLLSTPIFTQSFIQGQTVEDGNSHGTHTLGTILARDPNIGVAPKASSIVLKVLSNQGSGGSDGIAKAIRVAVDKGADLINMSIGGGGFHQATKDAITYAFSKGCLVFISAGNSGFSGSGNTIGEPAKSGNAGTVGATKQDGTTANFSSGGTQMKVVAPGQQILSSIPGGGNGFMSGTSMACPFVVGCFALIIERMRALGHARWTSPEPVFEFIKLNSKDLGTPGHDPAYGHGRLQMTDIMVKLATGDLQWT